MSLPPYGQVPPPPPAWPATAPVAPARPSRLLPIVATVLGLLGVVAGAAAWVRAGADGRTSYTAQQVSSDTTAVCEAQQEVERALTAATNQPEEKDPKNKLVVAVNVRLALYAGADYLSRTMTDHPAAPADVTDRVNDLADTYRRIAIRQLADAQPTELTPLFDDITAVSKELAGVCSRQPS